MATLVVGVDAGPTVAAEATRRRHTIVVLGIALLTRIAVVGYALRHFAAGWFFHRGVEMGLLAQAVLRGQGLSSPFGVETGPTAMIAPGYPLLVAGVFRMFGVFTTASAAVMMGLAVMLNVVTVWLILHLGRKVASERAAVTAGLFWACSLPVIWLPTIFWETNISAALLLGFVAVGVELEKRKEEGREAGIRWAGAGAYAGVAGLVNPALLPCLAGMGVWAAGRRWGRLGLAAAGFLVVFSVWPVRNAAVFRRFIPTRTTVGFELWMGNRTGATGYLEEALFPMFNAGELADYRARGEIGYMDHKGEMARAYVRSHPGATAWMTARRVGRFWFGAGNSTGSALFVLHALATTLLGGLGLWRMMRGEDRRLGVFCLIAVVLFPLPYYITHAEFRYRLVIDPVLCVLAARGMSGRLRRPELRA